MVATDKVHTTVWEVLQQEPPGGMPNPGLEHLGSLLEVVILRLSLEAEWGLVRLTRVVVMQKGKRKGNTQEGRTACTEPQRRNSVAVLQGLPSDQFYARWFPEAVQICRLGQKRSGECVEVRARQPVSAH